MPKVMMVGSAEKSGGGITTVIKLIKKMPLWQHNSFYWLGTQIQSGVPKKIYYALKAAIMAPFIMYKYDIIHFHIVPGITLLIQLPELIIAKFLRKKVLMEVHIGNQLTPYSKNKFFKWWLNQADLVLFLADKWKKLFEESYQDVITPSDVLYNACEISPTISPDKKKKIILFAGSMDDNKAPDILLNAWSTIKDKYPDWKILFLGSGNLEKFKKLAEELGIADNVEFTGYLTGNRKKQIFEEASIYCMCSYVEGFPMVVLEAWTHCIAVITTPVGGLPDVIEDGKNCLIFPFGDYKTLAVHIKNLIENEKLRSVIGNYGYEYAQNNFSLNIISDKLEFIYTSLFNNKTK